MMLKYFFNSNTSSSGSTSSVQKNDLLSFFFLLSHPLHFPAISSPPPPLPFSQLLSGVTYQDACTNSFLSLIVKELVGY